MTWLRWDTETPQSDVVGHLAEALGVGIPTALGHYLACCMSFGSHRPDGRAADVSDLTLEQWGLWVGKRGRFAAAFRARCVDSQGVIRGWWRQDALLRHQEMKRQRRKITATNRQKTGEEPAENRRRCDAVNDTIRYDTNNTPREDDDLGSTESAAATANGLGLSDEGHRALTGFLRARQNPTALVAEVRALAQGMRGPFTAEHVSRALHDLSVAGIARPTAAQLRGFTRRAATPDPQQPPAGETEDQRFDRLKRELETETRGAA